MQLSRLQTLSLSLSGLVSLSIGAFILFAPHAFYASYDIMLAQDPNLLSELRAPGAGLAGLGAMMLLGVFRTTVRGFAIGAAFTVFLAFPLGRVVSLALDGIPSEGVLGALFIELAIAALLVATFGRSLRVVPNTA